ncbi:hypothetical protein PIROE2DRAFT_11472 [Piromyces sp. E2]|nr:hypothetical protein PIROE2DRAFT_11472 [Piromyces sp. E2]|eukprot:OUM62275.1 hypothetical protein PIROE2DRAFT_11472 [Piromyces sp. E2]
MSDNEILNLSDDETSNMFNNNIDIDIKDKNIWVKTSYSKYCYGLSGQYTYHNKQCSIVDSKYTKKVNVNLKQVNCICLKNYYSSSSYNSHRFENINLSSYHSNPGVLLYEMNSRKFYVLFINSSFGYNNSSYQFYEFTFSKYDYYANQRLNKIEYKNNDDFCKLKINLLNDKDDTLQHIYLNMKEINGKSIEYNEKSIFYDTGDITKDQSNKDIINKNPSLIKLATVDVIDNIKAKFE